MQVGPAEVRPAPNSTSEGAVGQIQVVEIGAALVGQRVVDGFLKERSILQSHACGCVKCLNRHGGKQEGQR